MMLSENSFYYFLSKIREKPCAFLGGEQSFSALIHFWEGYVLRTWVECWEKANNIDFLQHSDEFFAPMYNPGTRLKTLPSPPVEEHFMYGFLEHVYAHYDQGRNMGWRYLITRNSASDEEAFDKFFELLDEFLAQKGEKLP